MTHEAYRARDNWDFWSAMEVAFDEYSVELNRTPAFWELTRRAHQDAVALRLGRLYEPHATATSLENLLQTIKENRSRARVIFPEVIADLIETEIDADIAEVSNENPIVAKLLLIRNEYLAHRGARHVTKHVFIIANAREGRNLQLNNKGYRSFAQVPGATGIPLSRVGPSGGRRFSEAAIAVAGRTQLPY